VQDYNSEGEDLMRKKNIAKYIYTSVVLIIFLAHATIGASKQQESSDLEIETTIRQFCKALAELDAESLKQTLDWPVAILASGKPVSVLRTEGEFDAEFKRSISDVDVAKRRAETVSFKISALKIGMLGEEDQSAYATYTLETTLKAGMTSKTKMISVLRRNIGGSKRWKIAVTNLPK
jgi:hypothetical protein